MLASSRAGVRVANALAAASRLDPRCASAPALSSVPGGSWGSPEQQQSRLQAPSGLGLWRCRVADVRHSPVALASQMQKPSASDAIAARAVVAARRRTVGEEASRLMSARSLSPGARLVNSFPSTPEESGAAVSGQGEAGSPTHVSGGGKQPRR